MKRAENIVCVRCKRTFTHQKFHVLCKSEYGLLPLIGIEETTGKLSFTFFAGMPKVWIEFIRWNIARVAATDATAAAAPINDM